jgi:hypothetical protein
MPKPPTPSLPENPLEIPERVIKRFWSKVNKNGPTHPIHGQCWTWTGSRDGFGYGYSILLSMKTRAHRVSWEIHFGEIPDGLCVLHKCDDPSCVNPDHLFTGTQQENVSDMVSKGRTAVGEAVGSSKLTEDHVRFIREVYKPHSRTCGIKSLARSFGVSRRCVIAITKGRTWKHVT